MARTPKLARHKDVFFSSGVVDGSSPGNGTVRRCFVVVPFKHKMTGATLYCHSAVGTGTISAIMSRVDHADDIVTSSVVTSDTIVESQFDLAANDSSIIDFTFDDNVSYLAEHAKNTCYFVNLIGTNSADRMEDPVLTISVTVR